MNLPKKDHSAEYIKRQAKKIKKETGVPHHEALEKAAKNAGFSNWKHALKASSAAIANDGTAQPVPRPAVVPFYRFLAQTPDYRPNTRMPIAAHQEIGRLLKEVCAASHFARKSVYNPINSVRSELDEWIAREYISHQELPNYVFLDIYYHGPEDSPALKLSTQQKDKLISDIFQVKEILGNHYHDCKPLRSIYKRLGTALKAIERWSQAPTKSNNLD